MSTYHYEQLDDERFQHLCQALLTREFPGTQCFPVGQRDGGRDGIQIIGAPKGKYRIFQVKFVRNPFNMKDPHKWLVETMNGETPAIRTLLAENPGALEYILVTNVPGTAFPEFGSIDKLNGVLNTDMPVPIRAWWRDDLDRRCDGAADVKWTYPDILRGTDVLQAIAASVGPDLQGRRADVLRSFAVAQFDQDSEVRFKQVEISNDILGLFVDVPAKILPRQESSKRRIDRRNDGYLHAEPLHEIGPDGAIDQPRGAADLLLSEDLANYSDVVVLEGGPGQGKSTLAQYVCQVHRMKILGDEGFSLLPDAHRPQFARFPIKVDLREYATWLSGKNPFSQDSHESRPVHLNRSLESFISALISEQSGGLTFTPDDLSVIARSSSLLIMLDGLDEVAEVKLRNDVVREITITARRLRDSATSLQLLVTTRPSALAEVSDFPSKFFHRWKLTRLGRPLIEEYAGRWAISRKLPQKEASELRRVLADKLDQPHMRDLARNPMQLAILLSVIHTRGSSLPDKRTALYDIYVELFLAREADKSEIVKKRQEILIDVHRYLAWVLHSEAETGRTLGKIDASRLRELIKEYLIAEDRDPNLADELFTGLAQRVVFLVGAVEGLFEFEVQPLREYFAGRFLYETAPYSPVGSPRAGTKDERFDAVARNTYWLNVTRFYAGCFSKGELPSLVDRLEVLATDSDLGLTSHPRSLAATLVADWVFSQNARSLKKVIDLILRRDGVRSLLGDDRYGPSGEEPLALPDGCGREELLQRCMDVLQASPPHDILRAITQLAQRNGSFAELSKEWILGFETLNSMQAKLSWVRVGYFLGILPKLSTDSLKEIFERSHLEVDRETSWFLLSAGHADYFPTGSEQRLATRDLIIDGRIHTARAFGRSPDPLNFLSVAVNPLNLFNPYYDRYGELNSVMQRQIGASWPTEFTGVICDEDAVVLEAFGQLLQGTRKEAIQPGGSFQRYLQKMENALGTRWTVWKAALSWLLHTPRGNRSDWPPVDLFDESVPVSTRLGFARHQAGAASWWRSQLGNAVGEERHVWVLAALLLCGPSTLAKLCPEMDSVVEPMDAPDAERMFATLGMLLAPSRGNTRRVIPLETMPDRISPRLAAMLCLPIVGATHIPIIKKYINDYLGDESSIHEVIFQATLAEMNQGSIDWARCVEVIRRAYLADADVFFVGYFNGLSDIPIDVARKVATNASSYPHSLVRLAEASVKRDLAARTVPLSQVAASASWFDEI